MAMRRFGWHNLRYRKNKGTSCLIVVLCLLLAMLLLAFWKLNAIKFSPAAEVPQIAVPADSLKPVTPPMATAKIMPVEAAFTAKQARMIDKGHYLLIEKSKHQLSHYLDGKLLASYTVALGKNPDDKTKEGDNATPEGHFEVNFIKDSSTWTHNFGDGKGEIKGAYGPWFIALYTGAKGSFSGKTWRGIGIHGTHNPASIGTNASEGCIRLHNAELLILKKSIDGLSRVPVDIIK